RVRQGRDRAARSQQGPAEEARQVRREAHPGRPPRLRCRKRRPRRRARHLGREVDVRPHLYGHGADDLSRWTRRQDRARLAQGESQGARRRGTGGGESALTQSVASAIRAVLLTGGARGKVMAAWRIARDWRLGRLAFVFDVEVPDRPVWPTGLRLQPPAAMPKRGRGGSERNRIALWHSLAHIEFVAIDLA